MSIAHGKSIAVDLDKPLVRVNVGGVMASNDKQADQYSVSVTRSGANVPLTGCSAHGYMILPNGETIKITGTVSGNTASVIIPQSGYAYDGAFTLAIKVSGTDYNATVAIFDGYIAQTVTETIVDGDRVLYGVDEILALIDDMEDAEQAATTAATNANTKATAANNAASAANTAASNANTKATAADTAASAANNAAAKINNMTVAATGLAAGAAPTATVSEVSGHKHIAFGIPQGAKGDTGATPALSIGTVTTGAPGTQASASMGGTAAAPVLNLTIPRGDAGSGSVSTVDSIQPDGGNVPLGAVRYSAAQTLSDAQKQQARNNIGAGTGSGTVKTVDGETPYVEGDVHINAVRYTSQTLTEAQKTQARTNIAALGTGDVVNNLTSTEASKPLSAAQGKALKELIDNQTGGDPTVVEITATALASKNTTQRAAMYTDGARLLKVTNGDTVVILSLASDGSTQWEASNKPLNNLLDNSDFANLVNQRGNNTYTTTGYTIDRWRTWANGTVSCGNGYLSTAADLYQYVGRKLDTSKVHTIAAMDTNNNVVVASGNITDDIWEDEWVNLIYNNAQPYFRINAEGQTRSVVWAALYEGAYTIDTLPPYTPKGYEKELLTCMRYYQTLLALLGSQANSSKRQIINFKVQMRATPTITYEKYAGDDFETVTCNTPRAVDLKTTSNYTHALVKASADL